MSKLIEDWSGFVSERTRIEIKIQCDYRLNLLFRCSILLIGNSKERIFS